MKRSSETSSESSNSKKSKNKPIHIPLDFETAIDGLLRVQPTPKEKTPAKKPGSKKKNK